MLFAGQIVLPLSIAARVTHAVPFSQPVVKNGQVFGRLSGSIQVQLRRRVVFVQLARLYSDYSCAS